jgi:hypothetical protein
MPYWITFADNSTGCIEQPIPADYEPNDDWRKVKPSPWPSFTPDDALALATELTGKVATKAQSLPYPANPRINRVVWPRSGACPSFCYSPTTCAGRTSCPKSHSCVD